MIWESLTHFRRGNVKSSEEALKSILSWVNGVSKLDYFIEREKKYSFGIGKGVVLYKERGDREEAELSMLISSTPVKYDSFDGVPISVFCFLSSPLNNELHLKYISRFYRLMNFATFRENLLSVNSKKQAEKLIKREEESFEE